MAEGTKFILASKYVQRIIKDKSPTASQSNASIQIMTMQTQEEKNEDRYTVNSLCQELEIEFPDEILYSKMSHHQTYPEFKDSEDSEFIQSDLTEMKRPTHRNRADFNFIQSYLTEMKGPTHRNYKMRLLDTWQLSNLNSRVRYASEMKNHSFLMVGIPAKRLYTILRDGMVPLASNKAVFGENGFYFTSCSTKAANQGCADSWNYERHADQGDYQPNHEDIGYIMFCDVALGTVNNKVKRQKSGITHLDRCDSFIFRGLYSFVGVESVRVINPACGEYEVDIPRGPLIRAKNIQKISPRSTDYLYYDYYYVQNLEQINPRFLARISYEYTI